MTASYGDVYRELFGAAVPQSILFSDSDADLIRPARGFVDGFDLTMQTQVGCPAGCLFCYVPSGRMLTPAAMRGERGERWGFEVRSKRHVLNRFARHLDDGDLAEKTIYWSGVTDPYATRPAETRGIWELLAGASAGLRPRRMVIQTRFRPDRDMQLMAGYTEATHSTDRGPAIVISYSIGTDRNDLIRAWERATPPYEQRLKTIERLRAAGIFVVPTLSPFGFWDDLRGMLNRFKGWDIPYITCLFFKEDTDSANTPTPFLEYLRREHPLLLDRNWQRQQLDIMRSVFGAERVLLSKAGFASLAAPHGVGQEATYGDDFSADLRYHGVHDR